MSTFPITDFVELVNSDMVLAYAKGYHDGYSVGDAYNIYTDQLLSNAYRSGYDRGVSEFCDEQDNNDQSYADDMDGDHASALASAGFGTDEDYGGGCDDW